MEKIKKRIQERFINYFNYDLLSDDRFHSPFGEENEKRQKAILKDVDKLIDISIEEFGRDIDVPTKMNKIDSQNSIVNEKVGTYCNKCGNVICECNKKPFKDFMIFLMCKGMINTNYELPEKIIDQFLNPDKYDLIDA